MIVDLKTKDDLVYAYMYGYIVDKMGLLDPNGEYLFIEETWIHKDYRETESLQQLCLKAFNHKETQKTLYVYWNRRKYNNMSKIYPISKFLKLIKAGD